MLRADCSDTCLADQQHQSATARLASIDDFDAFKATVEGDPRANVEAQREQEYYASKSQIVTTLITVLGSLVAIVMALGAVFGALNTMYSAVSERSREMAVLRAIGFGGGATADGTLAIPPGRYFCP